MVKITNPEFLTYLVPTVTVAAFVSTGISVTKCTWSAVTTITQNRQYGFALQTFPILFVSKPHVLLIDFNSLTAGHLET